jgi:DNA repair protein RadC
VFFSFLPTQQKGKRNNKLSALRVSNDPEHSRRGVGGAYTQMTKKKATYPIPIREWSEDDRPREKLLKYGEHTLSNAELLAIIIRLGAPGKSAVDIGRELLHRFKSLRAMSGVDTSEFKKITGLKNAKIAQIKAAVELGRRMLSEEKALEGPVKSSSDVVSFLMPLMGKLKKERFVLLHRSLSPTITRPVQ